LLKLGEIKFKRFKIIKFVIAHESKLDKVIVQTYHKSPNVTYESLAHLKDKPKYLIKTHHFLIQWAFNKNVIFLFIGFNI